MQGAALPCGSSVVTVDKCGGHRSETVKRGEQCLQRPTWSKSSKPSKYVPWSMTCRRPWSDTGISSVFGPWRIYTYAPPYLTKSTLRGSERPFSMKLAVAQIGQVEWELVQPLEGSSSYEEFLAQGAMSLWQLEAGRRPMPPNATRAPSLE